MPKNTTQRAQEAGHTKFLVNEINGNNIAAITRWVENNLIKDSGMPAQNKISFYEAEKTLLSEYIDGNKGEKFHALLNAIDNEKFDREFKNNPNYPKLKANECRVLAGAIIESQRLLERDDSMHQELGKLLDTKYQALKTIGYDVSQIKTIDTAFQIVNYQPEHAEVQVSGECSTSESSH